MTLNRFILILSTLLITSGALAQKNQFSQEIAKTICSDLFNNSTYKKASVFKVVGKQFERIYFLHLTPKKNIGVKSSEGERGEDLFEDQETLVYSLVGRNTFVKKEYKNKYNDYKNSMKDFIKEVKDYKKTLHYKNYGQCLSELSVSEKTDQMAEEFVSILSKKSEIIPLLDNKLASSIFSHVKKYHWEQRLGGEITDLHSELLNPKQKNLVIIAHASKEGFLVDKDMKILPKDFFFNISEELMAVVIYSCHTMAVREYYGLDKISKMTGVNFIQPELSEKIAGFLGESVTPELFRPFIKKVLKTPGLKFERTPKSCFLEVNWKKAPRGFHIQLNQRLIGMSGLQNRFEFPCSVLKGAENTLIIFDPEGREEISYAPSDVSINNKAIPLKNYLKDGHYISSKVRF